MGNFDSSDDLYNTGNYKYMIFEIFCCSLAPYPFLNGLKYIEFLQDWDNFEAVYEVNDVLLLFCFLRVYIIFRFSLYFTGLLNARSVRICKTNGCEANAMFALKGFIAYSPFYFLSLSIIILLFVFAYSLRIFEG